MGGSAAMKALVVDDHGLFREGVCLLLRRMGDAIDTIYEAADAGGGLVLASRHTDLGLILLDINLPDLSGEPTVRAFSQARPGAVLVLLSAIDDPALARRCIHAGAQGFIHKSTNAEKFLAALGQTLAGHPVSIDPARRCLPAAPDPTAGALTGRQREVLARLCLGWGNKEIARDLGISDNTVRIHVAAVLHALGARTRAEAIVVARELDIAGG